MADDSAPPSRPYNLKIFRNAMVPLTDADGKARHFGPYKPVMDACELCPARCCRLTVKVSLPDAIQFCKTLGLPFFAGLTLVPSSEARAFTVDYDKRVTPDRDPEEWPGKAEIALLRRDDGGCANLISFSGYERCGVYGARPSTCRLYPVTWDADVARGGPALVMCAVPYAMTPDKEEAFYAEATRSIERWQVHDEVLDEWHAMDPEDGRTVESFLGFAIPRTAEKLGIDASIVLAPGTPMERLHKSMLDAEVVKY